MRFAGFLKFYVIAFTIMLLLFSFLSLTAVQKALWVLAFTIVSPGAFRELLKVRGVRKGDVVLVSSSKGASIGSLLWKLPGRALGSGRIGDTVEVEYGAERAVGEVVSCGGLFFPAEVNILYYGSKIEVEVEE